jgi:hypothetical protein
VYQRETSLVSTVNLATSPLSQWIRQSGLMKYFGKTLSACLRPVQCDSNLRNKLFSG